jgi:hypothetical protein
LYGGRGQSSDIYMFERQVVESLIFRNPV